MPLTDQYLSGSARTRYLTGGLAYFAQGIPKGLLHIALPAWRWKALHPPRSPVSSA